MNRLQFLKTAAYSLLGLPIVAKAMSKVFHKDVIIAGNNSYEKYRFAKYGCNLEGHNTIATARFSGGDIKIFDFVNYLLSTQPNLSGLLVCNDPIEYEVYNIACVRRFTNLNHSKNMRNLTQYLFENGSVFNVLLYSDYMVCGMRADFVLDGCDSGDAASKEFQDNVLIPFIIARLDGKRFIAPFVYSLNREKFVRTLSLDSQIRWQHVPGLGMKGEFVRIIGK